MSRTIDINPGPQHIHKTEPVGSSQSFDITEFARRRFVVMGKSRIKSEPAWLS